jgi:polyisoprenyl-teichoic acid--peptidoglycan teichoic acid transferase
MPCGKTHLFGSNQAWYKSIRCWIGVSLAMVVSMLWIAACSLPVFRPEPTPIEKTKQPTSTITPSATLTIPAPPTELNTPAQATFPGPTLVPVTAIPEPLTGAISVPDEVKSGILVGLDSSNGRNGRSNALILFFVNPRTSRASLITIPPDLFVYIPGYTMQRINVAYPVGGIELLQNTLRYNLGITPDFWIVAHPDDFVNLVNDLGGINVSVVDPIPTTCDGFPVGDVFMDGAHALCYVTLYKEKETASYQRSVRQEEVLRALFLRLVNGGNLVRMPELYGRYQASIRTNLGLNDLNSHLALLLNLGDAGRIGYFQINQDIVNPWILPDTDTTVYIPRREALQPLLQQMIDYVSVPEQLTDRISTLVHELTVSPSPSIT